MLQKVLAKPEEYRRKVAFILTGVTGIIIFAIWLIITQHNIKQAIRPIRKEIKTASEEFRESLPVLNEQEVLTTELMKKGKSLEIK